MKRPAILVLAGLALAAVLALGVLLYAWRGPGPAERPVAVVVPQGASLTTAARALEEAGAISSASRFTLLARLLG